MSSQHSGSQQASGCLIGGQKQAQRGWRWVCPGPAAALPPSPGLRDVMEHELPVFEQANRLTEQDTDNRP